MNVEEINDYGNDLAREMLGSAFQETDFKGILDYVLYQKGNVKAWKQGLITTEELSTLVIQHLCSGIVAIYKLDLQEAKIEASAIQKKVIESLERHG